VKGSLTNVLMVHVDRPSIEIKIFQTYFDDDQQNSPNKISYLFFPLYRKKYSTIIQDNDHFTEEVSIVAVTGLSDLNRVIYLKLGIKTMIQHLLLAVPALGTSIKNCFCRWSSSQLTNGYCAVSIPLIPQR
jgi:hypothetical protein